MKQKTWFFAVVYMTLSIVVEAGFMVFGRLRVPRDNAILAPVVLTVPPLLAVWIFGCRRPRAFFSLAVLTSLLTLIVTLVAGRLTGISIGLAEPIVDRLIAGALAMWIWKRLAAHHGAVL